jgi:MFS transporter, CP family, cyanate transporter
MSNRAPCMVLLVGLCAALHVSKLPPAIAALQAELGLGLVQAGFLLSTVQAAGMALGLAAGLLADKLGYARLMAAGLALLGVASAAGAFASGAAMLIALRGVEGLGFLLAAMPAPALLRQLVAQRGQADVAKWMGLWGAYMPTGATLALLAGPWVLAAFGWRGWWLGLSGLTLAVCGAFAWVFWASIRGNALRAGAADPLANTLFPAASGQGATQANLPAQQTTPAWQITLGSRSPWLVALAFCMYSGQWLAVVGFMPVVYAQAGLSAPMAGYLTALAAAANAVGNIAAGKLISKGFSPDVSVKWSFVTMFIGAFLVFADLSWAGLQMPVWGKALAVCVFSGVGGMIPATLFGLAVRLAPSPHTVAATVGWMQQLSALGQFAGPPMVAWWATRMGGWQGTWMITGLCCTVGVALSLPIGRALAYNYPQPNDQ